MTLQPRIIANVTLHPVPCFLSLGIHIEKLGSKYGCVGPAAASEGGRTAGGECHYSRKRFRSRFIPKRDELGLTNC